MTSVCFALHMLYCVQFSMIFNRKCVKLIGPSQMMRCEHKGCLLTKAKDM